MYEGLTIYLDRYTIDLTLYVSHVGPRGDASSDIYVNCPGEQHSQKLAMQRQRDCALIFHDILQKLPRSTGFERPLKAGQGRP